MLACLLEVVILFGALPAHRACVLFRGVGGVVGKLCCVS